jgi:hypothetical protein
MLELVEVPTHHKRHCEDCKERLQDYMRVAAQLVEREAIEALAGVIVDELIDAVVRVDETVASVLNDTIDDVMDAQVAMLHEDVVKQEEEDVAAGDAELAKG